MKHWATLTLMTVVMTGLTGCLPHHALQLDDAGAVEPALLVLPDSEFSTVQMADSVIDEVALPAAGPVPAPAKPANIPIPPSANRPVAVVVAKPDAAKPLAGITLEEMPKIATQPVRPVAVFRAGDHNKGSPVESLNALMTGAPKGRLVNVGRPAQAQPGLPPLPKDAADVDWDAMEQQLQASIGQDPVAPSLAPAMPAVAQPDIVRGKDRNRGSRGKLVTRGSGTMKLSPKAMRELAAETAPTVTRAPEGSLLGSLQDKAFAHGVMMDYSN